MTSTPLSEEARELATKLREFSDQYEADMRDQPYMVREAVNTIALARKAATFIERTASPKGEDVLSPLRSDAPSAQGPDKLLDLIRDWMEAPVGKVNDWDAKLIAAYFEYRPEEK